MSKLTWRRFLSLFALACMALSLTSPTSTVAAPTPKGNPWEVREQPPVQPLVEGPFFPADNSHLPPAPAFSSREGGVERPNTLVLPKSQDLAEETGFIDPLVQRAPNLPNAMPAPVTNWEGIASLGLVIPPDTDGQVGPNHYVQIVNHHNGSWVRVWDKAGNQLYDFGLQDLWDPTDPCNANASGDPVVLYDQMSDRWLLTQFVYPFPPAYECIAISKGPTPTNNPADWYVYSFPVHNQYFNDYPKLGVWPDGYYMMAHQFSVSLAWRGTGVWVFDRTAMLNGGGTTFQYINLYPVNFLYGGMLPSNLMGSTLPPSGSPNYFVEVDMNWSGANDVMTIFEASANWPNGFTFNVVDELVVAPFVWPVCNATRDQCIHQPGTGVKLEAIADRMMMHAWYRNMGSYEVIVASHTVDAGNDRAGIRWYEVRKDTGGTNWYIYQQGTYAPDTDHRWMGSIAMDHVGNIALGYSVSSETTYPSIRYAGRLVGDPLGQLSQGEATIINGGGSQLDAAARWGDYSAMSVDPADDCTFWYTQEYMASSSNRGWKTRVASFKFPTCDQGPQGTVQGTVLDGTTFDPIPGASVEGVGVQPASYFFAVTGQNGDYQALVSPDTYGVTASAFGYLPDTVSGVEVLADTTTVQDFILQRAPNYLVEGVVRNAITSWPLYARIDISGYPYGPIWTDPVTGYYQVALPAGGIYSFNVSAFSPGYLGLNRNVGPLNGDLVENFSLLADLQACTAPGYQQGGNCTPLSGGLVLGNVYDDNTMEAITGAQVSNQGGYATTTVETPDDPAVDDGFYTLFSPAGSQQFTASLNTGYTSDVQTVSVASQSAVGQDFYLTAGLLNVLPESLEVVVGLGSTKVAPMSLNNDGTQTATFELIDADPGYGPLILLQKPLVNKTKSTLSELSPSSRSLLSPLAVGDELFQVDAGGSTGHSTLLGVEYGLGSYWVTSAGENGSLDVNYLFQLDKDGTEINRWEQGTISQWGWRDLAFDGVYLYTRDSSVVVQVDPATGSPTGTTIPCPITTVCRALAYDPDSDHFWTANWSFTDIYEFDRAGTVINAFPNSLNIYGMAWDAHSPGGPYLWAWSQDGSPQALATQINPTTGSPTGVAFQGSSLPGLDNFAGGATIINGDHPDHLGQLIFVGMHQADSDTIVGYDLDVLTDVSWLSESPSEGTIGPSAGLGIDVTFDASVPEVDQTGVYSAVVRVVNDTPYGYMFVPARMIVVDPTDTDLQVTMEGSKAFVEPGGSLIYEMEVTNRGPAQATNVSLTDNLPSEVSYVSDDSGCSHLAGVVTCSLGTLASGASQTVNITVTVNQTGALVNQANVSGTQNDPLPANNSASVNTQAGFVIFLPTQSKP